MRMQPSNRGDVPLTVEETPMRRIAVLLACLFAGAVLVIFLVPARASAPTAAGLHEGGASGAAAYAGVQLVRHGGGFRGGYHGGRAYAFRGGPRYGWRGRGWRRPGWGWAAGATALAAPYYYRRYRCPLVRRTVWTPYGYRVRWVRSCY
jgi:hypothetical protein